MRGMISLKAARRDRLFFLQLHGALIFASFGLRNHFSGGGSG